LHRGETYMALRNGTQWKPTHKTLADLYATPAEAAGVDFTV